MKWSQEWERPNNCCMCLFIKCLAMSYKNFQNSLFICYNKTRFGGGGCHSASCMGNPEPKERKSQL